MLIEGTATKRQRQIGSTLALLRGRWGIVAGAMIGLVVGTGPILTVTFALFIKPVTQDLGWSRGAFSAAVLVASIAVILMQPIFGWLMDNFGVKKATIPFILLMSAALTGLATMSRSLVGFYLIYLVAGLASCAQAPPMYAKVVSLWFDRKRGIALGIATSGAAIGTIVIPLYAQYLIGHYGWRAAYFGLGLVNLVVATTVVALILREPPDFAPRRKSGVAAEFAAPPGVSLRAAMRTSRFWMLAAVFLLLAAGLNGTLTHSVALLTDRGWTAARAVALISAGGVANILGRFAAGWLLDRTKGPAVPALFVLVPAVGCVLLAMSWVERAPLIAIPMLSFSYGADVDVMAYFTSRYFGLRNFGQIYGTAFSAFAVGSGIGPVVMGRSHDLVHSYTPALLLNAGVLICAYFIVRSLGNYVYVNEPAAAQRV